MAPRDLFARAAGGLAVGAALFYAIGTLPTGPIGKQAGVQTAQLAPMQRQDRARSAPAAPGPVYATPPIPPLVIPVEGVQARQLVDTFTQARANGARRHDAIDIMAPTGTPVKAAAAGTVEKLFLSRDGGNTIYVRSGDRRIIYYYAHLQAYALGLKEGQAVRAGQVIGTVGFTGNANPAGPHLHFAMMVASPDAHWWDPSMALNPYPLLVRR